MENWRSGTLLDDSTPYAKSFSVGQRVYFRPDGPRFIVINDSTVRFVTLFQVRTLIAPDKKAPEPFSTEQRYRDIQLKLLLNPHGYGADLFPVVPLALPPGFPQTYEYAPVIVSLTSPVSKSPGWMGEHFLFPNGNRIIYFERDYAWAISDHERWDILLATLKHETEEGRFEVQFARAEWPNALLQQLGGLAWKMNGVAHEMTVLQVDGNPSEADYDAMLDRQRKEMGLPKMP